MTIAFFSHQNTIVFFRFFPFLLVVIILHLVLLFFFLLIIFITVIIESPAELEKFFQEFTVGLGAAVTDIELACVAPADKEPCGTLGGSRRERDLCSSTSVAMCVRPTVT